MNKKALIASVMAGMFLIISSGVDPVDGKMIEGLKVSESINEARENWIDYMFEPEEQVVIYLTHKETQNNKAKEDIDIPEMPVLNIKLAKEYQEHIWKCCYENNISYEAFIALMYVENHSFDIAAVGSDGHDKGLVQARDYYYKWHCELVGRKIDYFNPYDSIDVGSAVYTYYKSLWESKVLNEDLLYYTVNMYNMGETKFPEWLKENGAIPRTYSDDVLKYKEQLERFGTINEVD